MYAEVFSGLHRDVSKDIKVFTEDGNDEMILIGDIPFYSMCEHHLLPFHGTANVVYIPKDGKILGLSKVARIVDTLSRKPQLQERLTSEIADTIIEAVDARSVCVVIEAEHLCMTMRGIRKPGSKTVTSAMRGGCRTDARTRLLCGAVRRRCWCITPEAAQLFRSLQRPRRRGREPFSCAA